MQHTIPINKVFEDGIFLVGKDKYSKSYYFDDINYQVASREDQDSMMADYRKFINALDSNALTKITIFNRRINKEDFAAKVLIDNKKDEMDKYREEYNDMLLNKIAGNNSIVQERYITVSVNRKNIEEARHFFTRIEGEMSFHLKKLGSKLEEQTLDERLKILHDFYRCNEPEKFFYNVKNAKKLGHSFKDFICPDSMEIKDDYLVLGDRFARVLFIREYGNMFADNTFAELMRKNKDMMLSIDITPVETSEAVREVENRVLGIETDIANHQRRQNMNNNFSAIIPYDYQVRRAETQAFLDQLMLGDEKMIFGLVTIVHMADSKEELDNDTDDIKAYMAGRQCQIGKLTFQQLDGLNTVLPIGHRNIQALRTFNTESVSALVPFDVKEVIHEGGIYYGQNATSKNMIVVDRRKLLNGNSFILGVSGSGKSFTAKEEIVSYMLNTDADIIIIDPEREYQKLIEALGGETIVISATSGNHINALDMSKDYSEVDPVVEKSQFIQSLCEQIISGHRFEKGQQSIIDRCTDIVYREYRMNGYKGEVPTLYDFREVLLKQPEPEAQSLALELELFTKGSLNTFSKPTNVDTKSRLICYDILELGEQLKSVGMLVILDAILNRVTQNRKKGKETFIFIDEIYLLFMHEYSAEFLFKLWKRVRKYGAFCTGITQNVEDMLQSHTARTMLSNSEFIIMLNQAATDRIELERLLNITQDQAAKLTDAEAGTGLLKIGSALVPFENRFPRNTELYRLMTTKPGEK